MTLLPLLSRRRALLAALLAAAHPRWALADDRVRGSVDSRAMLTPETRQAIDFGLHWLAERQQADGTFGPPIAFNRYRLNPAVNSLCGLAFLASGSTPGRGPYGQVINRCLDYILSCAAPTGFIAEADTTYYEAPMYGHGFATLLLAELYGMTPRRRVRDVLHRAVQLIVDTQNREGGWRYTPTPKDADISVTACQTMALRAAHNAGIAVPKETIDDAVQYITRCQNPDGGFRYQMLEGGESEFPRSAAAVAALFTSGVTQGPVIEAGLGYLRQFRPGAPGIRDRGYYYYALYYGVQAAWHGGGDLWTNWYPPMRDELLRLQLADGNWTDQGISTEYATAMALISLQLPHNYLPIFQR